MKKFILAVFTATTLIFSGSALFADDSGISGSFTFPIKPGSNLSGIARDFGVSKDALLEANKENKNVKTPDLILSGGRINIPGVYSQYDIEKIKRVEAEKKLQALKTAEAGYKTRSANSGVIILLLMISGLITLILMFKYFFKYLDKTEELDSVKANLALAEMEIGKLRDSDAAKSEIILKKDVNLLVNQEQINALQLAKKEAESRRNELLEAYKQIDRLKLERGALFVELAAKVAPGDKVGVQLKNGDTMNLLVNKVRTDPKTNTSEIYVNCPVGDCIVNAAQSLKITNALSHMTGHSNLLPEVRIQTEPKEVNSSVETGEVSNGGIPD